MCVQFAFMALSAGVSAAGALQQGRAAAATAQANAGLYDWQARARRDKAEFDAAAAERRFVKTQGTAITHIASSGADPSSFYDILNNNASESALEIAGIRYQGRMESSGLAFQANASRAQAQDATTGSYFKAAAGVVSAFAPAFSKNGVSLSSPFQAIF